MTVLINKRVKKSIFPAKFIKTIAKEAMDKAGIGDDSILSISIVGIRTMRKMNAMWRNEDYPTDVLSFPMEEGNEVISPQRILGDVVICEPVLIEQANRFKSTPQQEFIRLLVHGILHLIGFDHYTENEKQEMDREAKRIEKHLNSLLIK